MSRLMRAAVALTVLNLDDDQVLSIYATTPGVDPDAPDLRVHMHVDAAVALAATLDLPESGRHLGARGGWHVRWRGQAHGADLEVFTITAPGQHPDRLALAAPEPVVDHRAAS